MVQLILLGSAHRVDDGWVSLIHEEVVQLLLLSLNDRLVYYELASLSNLKILS